MPIFLENPFFFMGFQEKIGISLFSALFISEVIFLLQSGYTFIKRAACSLADRPEAFTDRFDKVRHSA